MEAKIPSMNENDTFSHLSQSQSQSQNKAPSCNIQVAHGNPFSHSL